MDYAELYKRYDKHLCKCTGMGISLDISRVNFNPRFFNQHEDLMNQAYAAMAELEAGAIANPDENRMVGHYWLRNPSLAPKPELKQGIETVLADIKTFADQIHSKAIVPPNTGSSRGFSDLLIVGIGGSALGPQLVADALGTKRDKMRVHFMDNTDPDGMARTLDQLQTKFKSTLVVVISKSGGTPETRNGMLETKAAFEADGHDFSKHAVAVTGPGSKLDQIAESEGWLKRFPMEDWVGGRTSIMSAVGLLGMALQGIDIDKFLDGAARMDELTRSTKTKRNPAALLALMWYFCTKGKGEKDMVMLPYKDRLVLMSKYLQQLIMESLGKKEDLDGNVVHQGINVFGNKGSTDQHAYVQQLRDGLNNFFATFIVVLQDVAKVNKYEPIEVEAGTTSGDYLSGFFQGTRDALTSAGRESITLTLDKLDTATVGALIALYERAVGFYATMVNINAYHQPGVEAGKKAAAEILEIQHAAVKWVKANTGQSYTAAEVAEGMGQADRAEAVLHCLTHLAANKREVRMVRGRFEAL